MSHFQPIRAKLSWNVDIFDQWKLDFTPITYGCSLVFLSPPGDYFTFNQPNIKYLYVIWGLLHIRPCGFKKFYHVCKFILATMRTCKFFARNPPVKSFLPKIFSKPLQYLELIKHCHLGLKNYFKMICWCCVTISFMQRKEC